MEKKFLRRKTDETAGYNSDQHPGRIRPEAINLFYLSLETGAIPGFFNKTVDVQHIGPLQVFLRVISGENDDGYAMESFGELESSQQVEAVLADGSVQDNDAGRMNMFPGIGVRQVIHGFLYFMTDRESAGIGDTVYNIAKTFGIRPVAVDKQNV
jgi:hypothetical protein